MGPPVRAAPGGGHGRGPGRGRPGRADPPDVQENGTVLRLLSRVIYENVDRSDAIRRAAADQGTGYVYLLDARTPDPRGRVPAQDIVGAVRVDGGAPVAGSFQHNPAHRLLTGSGWFRLPDDLEAALRDRLRGR